MLPSRPPPGEPLRTPRRRRRLRLPAPRRAPRPWRARRQWRAAACCGCCKRPAAPRPRRTPRRAARHPAHEHWHRRGRRLSLVCLRRKNRQPPSRTAACCCCLQMFVLERQLAREGLRRDPRALGLCRCCCNACAATRGGARGRCPRPCCARTRTRRGGASSVPTGRAGRCRRGTQTAPAAGAWGAECSRGGWWQAARPAARRRSTWRQRKKSGSTHTDTHTPLCGGMPTNSDPSSFPPVPQKLSWAGRRCLRPVRRPRAAQGVAFFSLAPRVSGAARPLARRPRRNNGGAAGHRGGWKGQGPLPRPITRIAEVLQKSAERSLTWQTELQRQKLDTLLQESAPTSSAAST